MNQQPLGMSGGGYEFDATENLTVGRIAKLSKIWGIASVITGVLMGVALVIGLLGLAHFPQKFGANIPLAVVLTALAPTVIINLIVGWLYMGSGKALRNVVDTQGNDVALLMTALDKMGSAFRIEVIVAIIAMVVGLLAGVAMQVAH